MTQITWNTDVNAPCCPGEIVADDGRTILIQDDWGCPGVAATFGWALWHVRGTEAQVMGRGARILSAVRILFGQRPPSRIVCDHDGTDGTVDCPKCGVTAAVFMAAARDFLDNANGATADDPGYWGGAVAIRQGKPDRELHARKSGAK